MYDANFEMFVMCCAERADRVGRDLPNPEHVQQVEGEVRKLLTTADKKGTMECLEYLAFLLLFEEDRQKDVTLEGMRQRVWRAFSGPNWDWKEFEKGFEVLKKGKESQQKPVSGSNFAVADAIWRDAGALLA